MRIAVCDDDVVFRDELKGKLYQLLFELDEEYDVHEFSNGRELLASRDRFDLVFLDIEMDEIDGRRSADYYKEKREAGKEVPVVIFTTAYLEYLQEGYEHDVYRYLTKPILDNKLEEYYLAAKVELALRKGEEFKVPFRGGMKRLRYGDVYYFETDSNTREVVIHTRDAQYREKTTFKALEKKLKNRDFYKVHMSYIVNLKHVDDYDLKESFILLDNGEKVRMNREAKAKIDMIMYHYFEKEAPSFVE